MVKDDPKWNDVEPVDNIIPPPRSSTSGSKRSRGETSVDISDGHVNIDLNSGSDAFLVDDDDDDDDLEIRPSLPRPRAGRDKAKRAARFGDEKEKKEKERLEMKQKLDEHLLTAKQRKELQERYLEMETEKGNNQNLLTHLSIMEKK